MKCVRYEIYSKKTGKIVMKDFGWFDNDTNAEDFLKNEFSKFNVVICK